MVKKFTITSWKVNKLKLSKKVLDKTIHQSFYVFLLLVIIINSLWITKVRTVPKGDGLVVIGRSIYMYRDVKRGDFRQLIYDLTRTNELKTDTPPAPFIPVLVLIYYLLFGLMSRAEMLINSIFLAILLWTTYKIAERLYNKKVGILSALILNSFYIIQFLSKSTFLEFHISAVIALSYYMLLKTNQFSSKKYSILFGLIVGLASLVKYTFFIYLIPVMFYIIFSILKNPRNHTFSNLFLSFIMFIIVAGIWYIPMSQTYKENIDSRLKNEKGELYNLPTFSLQNLLIYPKWILNNELGLIYFILFIVASLWKIRKIFFLEIVIHTSFFIPLLLFMLFINVKFPSFIVPTLFSVAILISDFLINLKTKNHWFIAVLIVVYALYNLFLPFYSSPLFFYGIQDNRLVSLHQISFFNQLLFEKDFAYDNIMKHMKNDPGNFIALGEWTNVYFFTLEYYNLIYNMDSPFHYFYYRSNILMNQSIRTLDKVENLSRYVSSSTPKYILLILGNGPKYSEEESIYLTVNNKYREMERFDFSSKPGLNKQTLIYYKKNE